MSCSVLQDFGAFYNHSSSERNIKDVYRAGRSPGNSAALLAGTVGHQASTKQGHYNGSTYNWSSQTQHNYGTVSGEAQSSRSSAWRGINSMHGQQLAYGLHSKQTNHSISNTNPGAGQERYSSICQATTLGKTQGLNNLPYVSVLESSGLHGGM